MTRKGISALGGALFVLLAVLLATPALTDWNGYRDSLARQLGHALGRPVVIEGALTLSLVPTPTFTAGKVRLADGGSDDLGLSISGVDLQPALLSLLQGRLEIASLRLHAPEIRVGRLPSAGHARAPVPSVSSPSPSTSSPSGSPAAGPAADGPAGRPTLPSLRAIAPRSVASVIIDNGTLVYAPAGRAPLRLEAIGASLTTSGTGGTRLVGTARVGSAEVSFDALEGSDTADTPVSLSLSTAEGAGLVRFGGVASGTGPDRRIKGKLTVKASDPGRVARSLGLGAVAFPAGNLSLEATATVTAREVDLDSLLVSLAGADGQGNASVVFSDRPQIDVKLGFGRLDLDALLAAGFPAETGASRSARPAPPAAPPTSVGAPASSVPSPSPSPSPSPATPAAGTSVSLPADLSLALDIGADVAVFRGGLVRGAHLNAILANGEATVNQVSVSLPGDTDVNLFGILTGGAEGLVFDGSFEAASDNPRGLLDWLKVPTASVPADRLHAARLAGKITVRPDEISLNGAQLRLDGTRIDAAVTVRPGPRPAIGVNVAIDTLNLDAYWPAVAPPPPVASDSGATPAPASAGATSGPAGSGGGAPSLGAWLPGLLAGIDANIKGRLAQLSVHGLTAQTVVLDGSWQDGALTLREASAADLAGASLSVEGTVDGLAAGTPTARGIRFHLGTRQAGRLLRQTGIAPAFDLDHPVADRAVPDRLGPVTIDATLTGPADALTIDGTLVGGGGTATVAGRIAGIPAAPALDLHIGLHHPATSQLLRLLAPDYRPAGAIGAFQATARLSGGSGDWRIDDADIKAGPAVLEGEARISHTDGRPHFEAALTVGDVAIDPFLPSAAPAKGDGLVVPSRTETPHQGLPVYATDKVSAAPRTAVATGAIPDHWSRDPLDPGVLSDWDGSITVAARSLSWRHTRLSGVHAGLSVRDGALALNDLSAGLYGGSLKGDGRLTSDGTAALHLALTDGQVAEALPGVADLDLAEGGMAVELSLSTSGQSIAEWIGRLGGTGRLSVGNGVVRGFDLKAVDDRLRTIDGPTGLLALIQAGLNGGKTRFDHLSGNVHIQNGMISTDDLEMVADGGRAHASAAVNLPAYVMDGRIDLRLAGAPSAPPLVMRISGPIDRPRRILDVNEIQQWLVGRAKARIKDAVKGMLR